MWFKCIFSLPPWWSRINVQAPELWEKVRKGKGKKKTQEDRWRNTTACSDGAGYALLFEIDVYICISGFIFSHRTHNFKQRFQPQQPTAATLQFLITS